MNMKAETKYITSVLDAFQSNKGRMSLYCYDTELAIKLTCNAIRQFNNKRHGAQILCVVDCYDTRVKLFNTLKNSFDGDKEDYNIKCISYSYINTIYKYKYLFIIFIGVNEQDDIITILAKQSKFALCILTKNIMNNKFITNVRNVLPDANIADVAVAIASENIISPVEEHRYGVTLNGESKQLYDKSNEFIIEAISIFGSLDNIEKCKYGDSRTNESAESIRNKIAVSNGWNAQLDVTIEFMRKIDDIYNPISLEKKAKAFYNIAKQRRDCVTDSVEKLPIIKQICEENTDKRIVIISKRGEFAATITKYLRENNIECGDYHDCLDDIKAIDEYGNPILVKSGVNAGAWKTLGAQAQSSLNERLFNDGKIRVLSIKESSNPKLSTTFEIAIITSPLCNSINTIRKRFINSKFSGVPFKEYLIYCTNTIEHDKINREKLPSNIEVIDETENNSFICDENYGDIIL